MIIKEGVQSNGIKPEILLALMVAEKVWDSHGQELVVTSITDGKHSDKSRHYIGMAVDLRHRYFSETEKRSVVTALKNALGSEYVVVVHKTHIHVQFDG